MLKRIQRKRTKGWKMPPNTVSVCRPGKWGNPFKVGGWYMIGDPDPNQTVFRMAWCRSSIPNEPGFTLIKDNSMAVEFYRQLMIASPRDLSELRGKNLACWCKEGEPCHADVLLELANS